LNIVVSLTCAFVYLRSGRREKAKGSRQKAEGERQKAKGKNQKENNAV
jgi:hypothetical protein